MYVKIAFVLLFFLSPAHADCWHYAGGLFNISPKLLYSIALQESSLNPTAVGRNLNGSEDIGLMQINSQHLPRLEKLGINKAKLKDPCISIIVGASILSDMMVHYGYTWEAVGAYNAGTAPDRREKRMLYAEKVSLRYHNLNNSNLFK